MLSTFAADFQLTDYDCYRNNSLPNAYVQIFIFLSACKDLEALLYLILFEVSLCISTACICVQMSRLNRLAYANVAGFSKTLLYQTLSMSPELAFAAGINGARSDHKVAMPSSSLAAIPEGTATNATSGSGAQSTSSAMQSSSSTGKHSSSTRVHQQSTQTTGLVVGGSTSTCLLYTSPSPRDGLLSRMPSSA